VSGMKGFGQRLYRGEVSYDFVGRWKRWYAISAIILIVSVGALAIRGLNLGIEFRGGADFAIPNATCSVAEARDVAEAETGGQTIVTAASSGTMRVQTIPLTSAESVALSDSLGAACGVPGGEITVQVVGPTWGAEISTKALQGLLIFLALVSIFLAIYFEWRMAVGALVALAHDLVITIGIYAAFGLEVTPATAIGVLTILAYSLYDTVVVYDKVKESAGPTQAAPTRGQGTFCSGAGSTQAGARAGQEGRAIGRRGHARFRRARRGRCLDGFGGLVGGHCLTGATTRIRPSAKWGA